MNLGYFPSISWHNKGCKILGLFTPEAVFLIFLNFDLKRENSKEKVKKDVFWKRDKG